MNWGIENGDVSCGNYYMNSHTISEVNNNKYIDYTKKGDENASNLSTMEYTGLQDGVDIDVTLPVSTLDQYDNTE